MKKSSASATSSCALCSMSRTVLTNLRDTTPTQRPVRSLPILTTPPPNPEESSMLNRPSGMDERIGSRVPSYRSS
jgi:hypothetical protein